MGKRRERIEEEKRKEEWNSTEMGVAVSSENTRRLGKQAGQFFDRSDWLSTIEAAIYLRKISSMGVPSINAVHKLVANGTIRRRKFAGRLFFRKQELDFLIESSVS